MNDGDAEAMLSDDSEIWWVGPALLGNVHPASACADGACGLHNPSDHPLRDAPLRWRGDRRIMERVCEHGVGNPDPDDLAYRRAAGQDTTDGHGCDGCCGSE